MKVYVLVGSSGTGKSYKALEVAYEKNIDYIIDDGLLIHQNKIIAGKSAKQAKTVIEAVKTAIFQNETHREEVKLKIKESNINKILVLGTSKKMVNQIINRLELDDLYEFIQINDISSCEEIEKAKASRKEGNHIIPVPTVQIKSISSGLSLNPLRRLFIKSNKANKILEKTIVRPPFSYIGKFFISPLVIEQIVEYEVLKNKSIEKINKIEIKDSNNVVNIYLSININDIKIVKNCDKIQQIIKEKVEEITLMKVEKIDIYINKLKKNKR